MFNQFFAAGLILMALLLALSHWFPWPVKLHRLAAYAIGCLAILAGSAVWLLPSGYGQIWLGFLILFAVAGLVTGLAYLIDAALRARVIRKAFLDE